MDQPQTFQVLGRRPRFQHHVRENVSGCCFRARGLLSIVFGVQVLHRSQRKLRADSTLICWHVPLHHASVDAVLHSTLHLGSQRRISAVAAVVLSRVRDYRLSPHLSQPLDSAVLFTAWVLSLGVLHADASGCCQHQFGRFIERIETQGFIVLALCL
jgi:hypothetical protein